MRKLSKVAPKWWDYTTLDEKIQKDAAKLTIKDMLQLKRKGFSVKFYDSREEFFSAEALEYITSWKQATPSKPAGICGPIGPTEQLPIVARMVNAMGLKLKNAHFWGMDEWYLDGKELPISHPLSFARADMELMINRIDKKLRMPKENIHFPAADPKKYIESYNKARCVVMQGGQGETKHWAFNDPVKREGRFTEEPPSPAEFRKLTTRVVELHPMTLMQNARTSGGGIVSNIPSKAVSVGAAETWKAEKVSIWHPGWHDNSFGTRLTALMISKKIPDSSVPMSLLADHPNVEFHILTPNFLSCAVEMH